MSNCPNCDRLTAELEKWKRDVVPEIQALYAERDRLRAEVEWWCCEFKLAAGPSAWNTAVNRHADWVAEQRTAVETTGEQK